MITFGKISDTEYRIFFDNKGSFDLFLLPNTSITNKFDVIRASLEDMSKVIGREFDKYIFALLSDYLNCGTDDDRFNLLKTNAESSARYALNFIDGNGIDYAAFADASKKSETSIFFDESEIMKLIYLSETLKIYSLISNTENRLSFDYHKKIYNRFVVLFAADSVVAKIYELIKSLYLEGHMLPQKYSPVKVIKTFNNIQSQQLVICRYDKNPIPFFVQIAKKVKVWRDPYGESGAYYDESELIESETEADLDDSGPILGPKRLSWEKVVMKHILYNLEKISFADLLERYSENLKNKPEREQKVSLNNVLRQIEYTSPFWVTILSPLLSRAIGIRYKYLKRQSPRRAALISFYYANRLKSLCAGKYNYLFYFACFYPTSQPPAFTQYRLKNIAYFIDSTLEFTINDLIRIGGSRINLVRLIELFVGQMRMTKFCNILTGRAISNPQIEQLEIEAIDYLTQYATNSFKTEIEGL